MKHVLTVTGGEAGIGLAGFLAARLAVEPAQAEAWVRAGAVYLDGSRERRPGAKLGAGQRVTARTPEADVAPPEARLVYRDRELAVVDKPAGLASMPLRQGGVSLQDQLCALLGREARLLHRLDRETSGLLLCALSAEARRVLGGAVAEHRLQRRYLALVQGELAGERELRSRLSARAGRVASSQDPRAAEAVTRVRPLRRLGERTLVEAQLLTGRTHQLRVHLAETGLPLVGDERYGGPRAPRLALHAHRLQLEALDGRRLDLHSPLPVELRALLSLS
jgi:23S rRNA pseudouridine1911/1915/1917 synthase